MPAQPPVVYKRDKSSSKLRPGDRSSSKSRPRDRSSSKPRQKRLEKTSKVADLQRPASPAKATSEVIDDELDFSVLDQDIILSQDLNKNLEISNSTANDSTAPLADEDDFMSLLN